MNTRCKIITMHSWSVPAFLIPRHATHFASFPVSYMASIPPVEASASHTGEVENILHPSALLESNPQTLHAPFERHL